MKFPILATLSLLFVPFSHAAPVKDVGELLKAVAEATPGSVVEIAEGKFELSAPLELRSGTVLKGAGIGKTILTHTAGWKGNPKTLPDPETKYKQFDKTGYLIHLADDADNITVSDMTLTGPQVHGAIYGFENSGLDLHHLHIEDFMYCGIRSYRTSDSKIHDCVFVDAGRRWKNGKPGIDGGIVGGGIFVVWFKDSEVFNNRFLDTKKEKHLHYYGIKGRKGENVRIHHNTIEANFSIEFAHENDVNVEIDHNILRGTVSIPKNGGGTVPEGGRSFHIHHNYFDRGYAIEFPRNGAEIDHNLFDCDVEKDGSNVISGFGGKGRDSSGPAYFHNNLVSNPGRGVIWNNNGFDHMEIRNNHIIARPGPAGRTEGLFAFGKTSDFASYVFRDNIVECMGTPRPLFRNDGLEKAEIANNKLVNVSTTDHYDNPVEGRKPGLEEPLRFRCGVGGERQVDGWDFRRVK